jgi:hypothetical protein
VPICWPVEGATDEAIAGEAIVDEDATDKGIAGAGVGVIDAASRRAAINAVKAVERSVSEDMVTVNDRNDIHDMNI